MKYHFKISLVSFTIVTALIAQANYINGATQALLFECHFLELPSQPKCRCVNNELSSLISPGNMPDLKKMQKIIEDITTNIHKDPNNAAFYRDRADKYFQVRDYKKAAADYSRLVKMEPKNTKTLIMRAHSYNLLEQSNKAIQDCQQALKLNPGDGEIYTQIAF